MKIKPRQHVLKVWPAFFAEIRNGEKTAELRKNDRGFERGDQLLLQEYVPSTRDELKRAIKDGEKHSGMYTGSYCICNVTAVIEKFPGLETGYCVLSIRLPASSCGFDRKLAGKKG